MAMTQIGRWTALAAVVAAAGCGEGGSPESSAPSGGGDEVLQVVEPGKEDNFFAPTAQEYLLTGTTQVRLETEYAGRPFEERLARARALVPFRQTVIGWFLNQYMVEKSHDAANKDYGGFKALTKNGSWEDLNLREVEELVFEFDFRQEIAGPLNLLDLLPTEVDADGRRVFELTIGRISTEEMQRLELNDEWYRKAPWSSFDPSKVAPERLEKIRLTIEPEPRSPDAWFDYTRLIEDGVLDIGVHFGWDYHGDYHLKHSRAVYDHLIRRGFESPVESYDALTRTSGPLTKKTLTGQGPVEIRVSLFWGKPGTETDPDTDAGGRVLEQDMRESLATRDIIVFEGHSGPFYGFALANWRKTAEGDLDDSELPDVEMPADRYQIVFAEGCDTYALGQGFFLNPAKADRKNLDIITTTSFSNASTAAAVTDFLDAFVELDEAGLPVAPRLSALLDDLDRNSFWFTTMYGVHGIDDNPRIHPWAVIENLCAPCGGDRDCGPSGNRCVGLAAGDTVCAVECTGDEGCPDGYICQAAQTGGWIRTHVCVPAAGACEAPAPPRPAVRIAKVVPRPDADLNGDGTLDARDDEMVVVVNAGDREVDLTGWALSDEVGVRYTFAAGTRLAPGAELTIFGGGSVENAAAGGLGLNDRGDTLRLTDARGAVVHEATWRNARPGFVVLPQ